MMGISAFMLKLVRSDFRPYVHDPEVIEKWITETGFSKAYQNNNMVWLTQVYVKSC
jgi:hypothetical protein